jgi:hypothetical protein
VGALERSISIHSLDSRSEQRILSTFIYPIRIQDHTRAHNPIDPWRLLWKPRFRSLTVSSQSDRRRGAFLWTRGGCGGLSVFAAALRGRADGRGEVKRKSFRSTRQVVTFTHCLAQTSVRDIMDTKVRPITLRSPHCLDLEVRTDALSSNSIEGHLALISITSPTTHNILLTVTSITNRHQASGLVRSPPVAEPESCQYEHLDRTLLLSAFTGVPLMAIGKGVSGLASIFAVLIWNHLFSRSNKDSTSKLPDRSLLIVNLYNAQSQNADAIARLPCKHLFLVNTIMRHLQHFNHCPECLAPLYHQPCGRISEGMMKFGLLCLLHLRGCECGDDWVGDGNVYLGPDEYTDGCSVHHCCTHDSGSGFAGSTDFEGC